MEEATDSEVVLLSCAGSRPATVIKKIIAINIRDKRIWFAPQKKGLDALKMADERRPELRASKTRGNGS
jgi:hypothetical protein